MYPVGLLFGLGERFRLTGSLWLRADPGFDTASSVAILAISAIAKHGSDGKGIKPSHIIILPVGTRFIQLLHLPTHSLVQLLFTAGMTLIDSFDSILMLYSYTGFPEHKFSFFVATADSRSPSSPGGASPVGGELDSDEDRPEKIDMRVKMNAISGLSIILTLMSILVAFRCVFPNFATVWVYPFFSISLITIMGLIGEECTPCREAAEDEDNHSLAARWWRGWARANEKSAYVGAAIVGAFLVVVLGWYCLRRGLKKRAVARGSSLSDHR